MLLNSFTGTLCVSFVIDFLTGFVKRTKYSTFSIFSLCLNFFPIHTRHTIFSRSFRQLLSINKTT